VSREIGVNARTDNGRTAERKTGKHNAFVACWWRRRHEQWHATKDRTSLYV